MQCTFLASRATLFDFLNPSPGIHFFPITREEGIDYHGWAIYADGGTRVVDGEIFAGWSVISRSPLGRIFVLFAPSLPMKLIRLSLVPEFTPTTPVK